MEAIPNPELTTAQLAARTEVPAGTLRVWESRHGFPSPARLPGGHRRYSERDVAAVREVIRLRRQGLSLVAAIARAAPSERPADGSLFAGLRARRPDLAASVLPRRAVLRISHAIEDEYLARGAPGLVLGAFQRERFYRGAERRWRELARTAELAVALAAFPRAAQPRGAPAEVRIEGRSPLAREWALIVDGPGAHACLTGWERPSGDGERRFEVVWSFDPDVVRAATQVASELLRELAPAIARRLPAAAGDVAAGGQELRFAGALSQRIVAYLASASTLA